jgi:hypothetical protein
MAASSDRANPNVVKTEPLQHVAQGLTDQIIVFDGEGLHACGSGSRRSCITLARPELFIADRAPIALRGGGAGLPPGPDRRVRVEIPAPQRLAALTSRAALFQTACL